MGTAPAIRPRPAKHARLTVGGMIQPQTHRTAVPLPRWLLGSGVAAFAASLAAYVLTVRTVGLDGTDLNIYLMGGRAFRYGLPLYEQQYMGWPFTYPPVTVLLFAPMSLLGHGALMAATTALGIAGIAVVIWLTFRMLGYHHGPGLAGGILGLTAAALWLQPVFDTLDQGQVNIALMLLVLADFALARHRRWPVGLLIGLATALKLTPGLFILYLLLTRRIRGAATAGITFVALTGLGFIVAPSASRQFWLHGLFADSARVAGPDGIDSAYNQSLHGVLVRAFGIDAGNIAWYPVAAVALLGGLAVAVAASRRGEEAWAVVACGLTGLLISPLSWHEHWVWVVPVLVLLTDLARRIYRVAPIPAGALPFVIWLAFLVWPMPGDQPGQLIPNSPLSPVHHAWETGRHNLLVLSASAEYPLIGLALLTGAGWLMWKRQALVPVTVESTNEDQTAVTAGTDQVRAGRAQDAVSG